MINFVLFTAEYLREVIFDANMMSDKANPLMVRVI